MRIPITPLPNTLSWRGAQLKAQGQLYFYLFKNDLFYGVRKLVIWLTGKLYIDRLLSCVMVDLYHLHESVYKRKTVKGIIRLSGEIVFIRVEASFLKERTLGSGDNL
jgi:hypothetical protein